MASAINDNYPVQGNPTTQSVRDNFAIAKNEITNLQSQLAGVLLNMPYMPLAGAAMTGPLILHGAPTQDLEPATKAYVDLLEATVTALDARVAALENPLVALDQRIAALEKH
jgi:outer membrane murein-binding lipoprotein Lpp